MSQSPMWWRILVLSTIVLCIAFAVSASGQGGDKAGSSFGTVDFQKVGNEYKGRTAVESELSAMKAKFQARLARRDQMPLLTEEEQKSLDDLYEKGATAQTDADKGKIKQMTDKAQQLSTEIQGLRQKPDKDLTDADKKRLADTEKTIAKAQEQYTAMKDELESKVREYGLANSEKLVKEIRAAVAKVAEQKKLTIVFNSEVALYAGTDITPQVLSELNKK